MTAKYKVTAYDEEIPDTPPNTVVHWPANVEVLADTERQAISKAKKLVKRKNYRVTGAITVEAIRAMSNDSAMGILADIITAEKVKP